MTGVHGYTIPALLVLACCLLGRAESRKCCVSSLFGVAKEPADLPVPGVTPINETICASEKALECPSQECFWFETEAEGKTVHNIGGCTPAGGCTLFQNNTVNMTSHLAYIEEVYQNLSSTGYGDFREFGNALTAALEASKDAMKCCDKDYCNNVELPRATALILVVSLFTYMFTMKL